MPWIPNTQISSSPASTDLVFNVQDYGAIGDGTTDDSGAIQAAIDAAEAAVGGTVYLPNTWPDFYGLASTLTIPGNVHLEGQSQSGAVLRVLAGFPTSTPVITCDAAGIVFRTHIRHLTINCDSKSGSVGIYMNNTQENCLIEDVFIINYASKGIHVTNVSNNFTIRGVGIGANTSTATHAIHLDNCPGYMLLSELSIGGDANLDYMVMIDAGGGMTIIDSSYFEGVAPEGIYVNNAIAVLRGIHGGNNTGPVNLVHTVTTQDWALQGIYKGQATHTVLDGVNGRTYDDNFIPYMAFGDYKYANWSQWTVTNPVTNRSIDVSAATLGDVRQVLGSLITDLKTIGLIDA